MIPTGGFPRRWLCFGRLPPPLTLSSPLQIRWGGGRTLKLASNTGDSLTHLGLSVRLGTYNYHLSFPEHRILHFVDGRPRPHRLPSPGASRALVPRPIAGRGGWPWRPMSPDPDGGDPAGQRQRRLSVMGCLSFWDKGGAAVRLCFGGRRGGWQARRRCKADRLDSGSLSSVTTGN